MDHDHAVERALIAGGIERTEAARRSIRGLLCRRCNRRLLPAAQDSVERLERAIEYLRDTRHGTQLFLEERALNDG